MADPDRARDRAFVEAAWREWQDCVAYGGFDYVVSLGRVKGGDPSHTHEWTLDSSADLVTHVCACGASAKAAFEPVPRAPRVDQVLHSMPLPPKRWVACELGQGMCGCENCESNVKRSLMATCNTLSQANNRDQVKRALNGARYTYPKPAPRRPRKPPPPVGLDALKADVKRTIDQLEAACARAASRSSKWRS